jgi:hypothetical protein
MSGNAETQTCITFIKGTGKVTKAQYKIGDASIPASAITRIIKKIDSLEARQQDRKFAAALDGKYDAFLDELDKAGLNISDAIQQIQALSIKPKASRRNTRESLVAISVSKLLARTYLGKPSTDMAQEFVALAATPSFQAELIMNLNNLEKEFGRSKLGKIRVRKETTDMKERAKKARKGKK